MRFWAAHPSRSEQHDDSIRLLAMPHRWIRHGSPSSKDLQGNHPEMVLGSFVDTRNVSRIDVGGRGNDKALPGEGGSQYWLADEDEVQDREVSLPRTQTVS